MSDFFSKDRLKNLAISILLLFGTNMLGSWMELRSYAYGDIKNSLSDTMVYLEELEDDIFQEYIGYEKTYEQENEYDPNNINALEFKDMLLSKTINKKTENFSWGYVEVMALRINRILKSENISSEDMDYLNLASSYISELHNIYKELTKDENIFRSEDFILNRNKKIYLDFLEKAEEVSSLKKYKSILTYEDEEIYDYQENYPDSALKYNRTVEKHSYNTEDEKRAKEFSEDILRKITDKDQKLEKIEMDKDFYAFENGPDGIRETGIYEIHISTKTGNLNMYQRVRTLKGPLTEKKMDERAADIIDSITDESYICYRKIPEYEDRKLQNIEYRFIRKTKGVYIEDKMIDLNLDYYGQIASINISDILSEKVPDIQPVSKKDIIEQFEKYDPEEIIQVYNMQGEVEYNIYIDFNGNLYTVTADAKTLKIKSAEKSEHIYYNEIILR